MREAIDVVRRRVEDAARRAGRDPASVRIVAISKGATPEAVQAALACGLEDFGENRADELASKAAAVGAGRWHFVGRLQTNKVRLLDGVELIHSLCREREAQALERRGAALGRAYDVLLQVNVAGEPSKQGLNPAHVGAFLDRLGAYPLVRPRGFMFMAPVAERAEDVRWVFAEGAMIARRYGLGELSMGMTDDFEVAIEEGATIVRIGRAIFGPTRVVKQDEDRKKDG